MIGIAVAGLIIFLLAKGGRKHSQSIGEMEPKQHDIARQDQRQVEAELVGITLVRVIGKCLSVDDLQPEHVPTAYPYNSPKCLGALFGLCGGIFEAAGIEPEGDAPFDALETAMYLVFGRAAAYDLANSAVEYARDGHHEFLTAAEFSRRDAASVLDIASPTSWVAYHLALHDMI